ncbi:MAG TPA: UDP-N-acetylglucosamine 2-epimerase (non-hydrolyzing) [Acidimicrobiales bacterium]|jgi:UDP-N-acetylglucosamine 2-epimerase (non-hydrolysing)|nr:UDP-N-acetylglucosamine 2-epimerase (non-hydrolyzing) [Acidimicrobiales bacterium]
MNVLVPFGTRPEIIKLAPIVHALRSDAFNVTVVATGQHHDPGLTDVFYAELDVRPDVVFPAEHSTPNAQYASILLNALEVLERRLPEVVVLLGDTNTVPLFCLAARRSGIPIAHLEAGLRSFNQTSVEELNRRVAGACASVHFAPTELARTFLRREGVADERIFVVGNPVLDVLRAWDIASVAPAARSGVLVTAHRATNVDDPARLEQLVQLLLALAEKVGPVTFPVHPRTATRLHEAGAVERLQVPGITLTAPLPYRAMVERLRRAAVVVTDSGGLQEEAAWVGVPVVVLRRSTPRWEGVSAGTSVLTGLDAERALAAAIRLSSPEAQQHAVAAPCPYGDGFTGPRVAAVLRTAGASGLLRFDEPDFVDQQPPS